MPTYISQEGLEELKEELKDREKNKRYEIADKIAEAKELGDLSENFEYKEAKDQQAANESRIAELKGMIQDAVIVEKKSGETRLRLERQLSLSTEETSVSLRLRGRRRTTPWREKSVMNRRSGRRCWAEKSVRLPRSKPLREPLNIKSRKLNKHYD